MWDLWALIFCKLKKYRLGRSPSSCHCAWLRIMIPSISLTRRTFNWRTVSSPSTRRRWRRINLFFRNTFSLRKCLRLLREKTIDSSLMDSFKNSHQSWRLVKDGKKRKWQSINFSIDVQKSLFFSREVLKFQTPGPRLNPVGISKTRETKSWSEIGQGEMSHSMLGGNKSLEIKNLSNLLPIDRDELNHVNSLEAGCKLRQTSTRAKSFFNEKFI